MRGCRQTVFATLFLLVRVSLAAAQPPALDRTVDRFVLDVAAVNAGDLSADGKWLAATTASLRDRIGIDNSRFQDPSYVAPFVADVLVIETATGRSQKIFAEKRQVRGFKWSPDASRLAFLALKDGAFEPMLWVRAANSVRPIALPAGKEAADNAEFEWSASGDEVLFAVRGREWRVEAKKRFESETAATVIVHSSKEPFLAWDDVRRLASTRGVIAYDVRTGRERDVLPQAKNQLLRAARRRLGAHLLGRRDEENRLRRDLRRRQRSQDTPRPGRRLANAAQVDQRAHADLVARRPDLRVLERRKGLHRNGRRRRPATDCGRDGGRSEEDRHGRTKTRTREKKDVERFTAVRLSARGERLVASDKRGLWLIDTASGTKELFVPMPEEDKEAPRYQVVDWSPDGNQVYLSYASRKTWERGLERYDVQAKRLTTLVRDGKIYTNFRLSKDGTTFVFMAAEGNRPADVYAANADFSSVRRLTTANPSLFAAGGGSKTELVSYLDVDGKKLYGVLYYPAGYESGKKYPTVFEIYEDFFDDRFSGTINVLMWTLPGRRALRSRSPNWLNTNSG